MPYITSDETVAKKKSVWRLQAIPEFFWGVLNFFVFFFRSIFSAEATRKNSMGGAPYSSSGYGRSSGGGGGGRGGGGGSGGGSRRGGPNIHGVKKPATAQAGCATGG